MRYEEFKETVLEEIQKYYGESVEIVIKPVLKNNSYCYDGLYIFNNRDERIVPIINMNYIYEKYINEKLEIEQCVEQVCQCREGENSNEFIAEFISKLRKWEQVKENIYPVLVLTDRNEEFLKPLAVTEFLDMSVIYRICEITETDGQYSININQTMMQEYGITVEQLHEQAVKNLEKENYQFISMDSYARALIQFMGQDEKKWMEDKEYTPMYILTNDSKTYGASGILDKELVRNLAGNENYFVILSCIHEAIFVLDDGKKDKEELNKIIEDIYTNAVSDEEQLSKHYYYYHGTIDEISMGDVY